MMAAHFAKYQSADALAAVIGMSSDAAKVAPDAASLAHLRKRTRVSDDLTARGFIHRNYNGLVKVSKHSISPTGIADRVKKLVKADVSRRVVICDLDSAFCERFKLVLLV